MTKQLSLILLILLLSACASTSDNSDRAIAMTSTISPDKSRDLDSLLMEATRVDEQTASELRTDAAEIAILNGNIEQARRIVETITSPYHNAHTSQTYLLVRAGIAIADGNGLEALEFLNDTRLQGITLTQPLQIRIGRLRADAYRLNRSYIASARERIYIDPLLNLEQRQANHEQIFSSLLQVSARILSDKASRAITSDLRGWLSLAAMTKQYQRNPLKQLQELNNWQRLWSHHPASSQLPASLAMLSRVVKEQPSAIALLLPTQGDLGAFGRAIRDGVIAAHLEQRNDTLMRIYNTAGADIQELVQRAVLDGAELIIGPLSRENVSILAGMELSVPVVALNRAQGVMGNPDLYQFGLAPEDEMNQVAQRVYKDGYKNALAIIPEGNWGDRNLATFRERWEALGGIIVEEKRFSAQKDYSDLVKSILKVDQSQQRSNDLRRMIGQRFEFTPRRRQDIDFIFLLANPEQARGINPTLAFFYADDIPVYATSLVHEHSESRIDTIDLNRIRFCDIPWKLTTTDKLQNDIQRLWASSKSTYASFYALGVDAYRLYPRLQQLKELPDERLFGATGILSLRQNTVIRQLMWAQFSNGDVTTMPLVLDQ